MKPGVLITAWIAVTSFGFWQYSFRYALPVTVDRPLKVIDKNLSAPVRKLLEGLEGKPVLVNFWNPDCGCSKFNEPHVQDLAAKYEPQGIAIITVVVDSQLSAEEVSLVAKERKVPGKIVIDDKTLVKEFDILAAPAAVIFDAQRNVVYRGGYNTARFCNNAETANAAIALDKLTKGIHTPTPSLPFYGCGNGL